MSIKSRIWCKTLAVRNSSPSTQKSPWNQPIPGAFQYTYPQFRVRNEGQFSNLVSFNTRVFRWLLVRRFFLGKNAGVAFGIQTEIL